MKNLFLILQFVFSSGLIGLIVIQAKGTGLGKAFGGGGQYHSKKGVEKVVFTATIVLSALFIVSSLINAFLA